MFTNKLWMRLLMAGILLLLISTAACGTESAINGPAEQALAEQGDAFMTSLKDGDFEAIYAMMSLEAQQGLDKANIMAGSWADLDAVLKQSIKIAAWEFEKARVFNKDGTTRGSLDGRVEYADGKSGEVHLELVQQDGTWKISSSGLYD